MQKTKILSAVAAIALMLGLTLPSALAANEYLPDVENVAAEVVTDGIQITWDAVAGADQYTLYYGTESISVDGASYENSLILGEVVEHTVTDLDPATTYYFAVAADDSTGTYLGSFNYSEEVSATTLETEILVDPAAEDEPVVDPAAENPTIEPEPEEEVISEPEVDPVEELVGGELYPAAEEPSAPPENLPKSGPATAVAMLMSGTGAYFWRKYRK
ncbi:MAG: fibronectin type III domain-containing protein [Candidatus Peribacteraceae bacterium]|nr:fibronectin type III domain-containing protein [Candidatus Peribacteraceae bacterium]